MEKDGFDALLEMHLHGELPPALRKKAERILATPEGQRAMEKIRQSDRRILEELTPERMAESIRRKLSAHPARTARKTGRGIAWSGWGAGAALTALAIALFAVVDRKPDAPALAIVDSVRSEPSEVGPVRNADRVDRAARVVLGTVQARTSPATGEERVAVANSFDDGIRTKGSDMHRLRLHLRENGGGVVVLRDGDTVPKAAILQVSLAKGPLLWVAVVSVDGAGQSTLHLPEAGDSAAHLDEETAAPHSFQLDESPGFERFFLIVSAKRFSLDEALALTRRSGVAVVAHKGWNIESIRVAKP